MTLADCFEVVLDDDAEEWGVMFLFEGGLVEGGVGGDCVRVCLVVFVGV
jgi:hypothetical protein